MKKIIILISCLFLLSGCYDYQELNDMSIVSGIGVDYKDNKYVVSLEIVKSSKDGSSTEIETNVITGEDENIVEAFSKAKNFSDKLVYMEHVEILVVSKNLSKHGISSIIDYLVRDTTINNNYFMVMADSPEEIFSKKKENESITDVIVGTIEYYLDTTNLDDIDIVASYILNNRKDIALPYIELEEENIKFNQVAYFNNDKISGFIDSKMFTFLALDTVNVNFVDDYNTIDVYKKKIDYEVKKNEVIVKISGYGKIKEINKNINLEDEKSYEKLEDIVNRKVKEETTNFLNSTLKDNSDLLGLEDKYYKEYKKDMKDIKFCVEVDITVNKNGTIYGVLNDN